MSSATVLTALTEVGSRYRAEGVIVECGTWLGASLKALCDGIPEDVSAAVWSFDRFRLNAVESERASAQGAELAVNTDPRPWIYEHVQPQIAARHSLCFKSYTLSRVSWHGLPIEIFVLDAGKRNPTFRHVMDTFGPYFLPGAQVCLLDAYYRNDDPQFRCQVEYLADHPELVVRERIGSSAFCEVTP